MEKRKILVVEGHIEIREALEQTFQQAGFTVLAAENTAVAFDLLSSFDPDLVLTDLLLPLLAGENFIKALRRVPKLTDIPIVVLTEYSDAFSKNAKAAGATEVLRKPRDLPLVIRTVKALLGE